uniref:Aromatic amino acid beta-eliminating lyase/threonine aldolase domain-containing protein n=1 Tax=Bionectria ochroleuca TaxID=29856 RepID=A0A0B7KRQ8_BIOOC
MASASPRAPHHQNVIVRTLPNVTPEEREAIFRDVEYNIFNFPAALLSVDFLTDSGTSAMTDVQWAAWDAIAKTSPDSKPLTIISNGFFDTTAANAKMAGFELQVFTNPALQTPFPPELIGKRNEFKGNLDITAAEAFLENNQVTMILLTITNNWAAGQPVSMTNIRKTARQAKKHDVPLFFDACRFAENAFFIQKFEDGFSGRSISEIVQEIFGYADGFTISLKKDGLANMGGVLCFHDGRLFARRYQGIGLIMKERQLICYGNDAYGGMSGRDLMAATAGLYETTKASFLATRVYQVQSFAQKLLANGVPVLSPPGGHAVFLDMNEFFRGCDRDPELFSSVGFTLELIKDYGIRAIESGPFAWECDKKTPEERAKIPDLVRFAVPRNVLSDEHIDYAVAAIKALHKRRHTIPNVLITRGKDTHLRHFHVGMKPVPVSKAINKSFVAEAERQLANLSLAVGQSQGLRERLHRASLLLTLPLYSV